MGMPAKGGATKGTNTRKAGKDDDVEGKNKIKKLIKNKGKIQMCVENVYLSHVTTNDYE